VSNSRDPLLHASKTIHEGPVARERSGIGRLASLARGIMFRTIRPFVSYQERVNIALLNGLESSVKTDAEILRELRRLAAEIENIAAKGQRLELLEAQVGAVPHMTGDPFEDIVVDSLGRVMAVRNTGDHAAESSSYADFEDIFRGSEAFIRARQERYVPLIVSAGGPCLDLGAGRGEMLDLLREAGVEAHGVDLDASMVRRAVERGLDVDLADGVDYLKKLGPGVLGAVFSAQVLEHLPFPSVQELIQAAYVALADDGVMLLETVNPHSYAALKTFWVDGTHQHPLFPEVIALMCAGAGFGSVVVFCPNGSGDFERDRLVCGEYTVMATKSSSTRS
jgi:2-polyprenyl-3-methyl-5-hydroxy-6-metoxy-1,4-benzoquinol methylase